MLVGICYTSASWSIHEKFSIYNPNQILKRYHSCPCVRDISEYFYQSMLSSDVYCTYAVKVVSIHLVGWRWARGEDGRGWPAIARHLITIQFQRRITSWEQKKILFYIQIVLLLWKTAASKIYFWSNRNLGLRGTSWRFYLIRRRPWTLSWCVGSWVRGIWSINVSETLRSSTATIRWPLRLLYSTS